MEILSNKKEIFNLFETIYQEIMNTDEKEIVTITQSIKTKMMYIGARMFENWFTEKIGNGYQGYKITDSEGNSYRFHNHLKRHYLTCLGEVQLSRSYYTSQSGGFFPIEQKFKWLKDEFFPDIKELACYVSMQSPYEMASEMIKKIAGLSISSSALQKITKTIGNRLVEKEDNALESGETDHVKETPDLLAISCDGACINTDDGWKEVKNGAIYQLKKIKRRIKSI
jgi:hypothetical protein